MSRFALCLLLAACNASTTQTRRTFPVEVVVTAPSSPLETGWSVSDLSGSMPLTELRFFEGPVLVGRAFRPFDLLVATAHAHPGHDVAGAAMGEVLTPLELDLARRDVVAWADANAVTGTYGSATLGFGATGVRVRGTATKAGQAVTFDSGALVLTAPLSGLRFEHEMTTAPGGVRIEVDLGVLLSRIEFDQTGSLPGPDGVVTFAPTSRAANGFDRGVTDATSYRFTWLTN